MLTTVIKENKSIKDEIIKNLTNTLKEMKKKSRGKK